MLKKKKQYHIGIDIGGTKMSAVLFDGNTVVDDYMLSTPKDSRDQFMVMLKALVDPLLEKAKQNKRGVEMIGIGVPGVLDSRRRKMLISPNLEIINNLEASEFENLFSLPVLMDNDVNCFIRAEMLLGAGIKNSNGYGLTIGTGIGGAWWFGGNVYRGMHGGGGEPGEMIINFSDGMRLEAAYHKLTQNNPSSLAEEAFRGDILAEKVFMELATYLGLAIANIVNLIDPEIIILGGGVMESSELFFNKTKKEMKENIFSEESRKEIKLAKSKLGARAGAIGAALLEE
jgi:glucokinase